MPTDPVAAAPNKEQPASQTQAAPAFPHPDAAKKVEDAANKTAAQVNTKALSVRQWLESAVVPVVYQGMVAAARERPDDPIEYLAAYLIEHNPKKKQKTAAQAGATGTSS